MKKRLLGAAVLIVLAVIFVPMLLPSHSDSGQQSVSVKIPPEPSGELQTRILKVGPDAASAGPGTAAAVNDPDHVATLDLEKDAATHPAAAAPPVAATNAPVVSAAPASAVVAAPAASAPPRMSAPTESAPAIAKTSAAPATEPVANPKPEPVPQAEPASKGEPVAGGPGAAAGDVYTVNLGIYADHASANKLVASAKQHGFTALATPETFQGKSVLRVRVGPFATKAQAEAARLKLKDFERVAMTVDSASVNQTGDAPASAVATGQPGAWAVQLAAFGSEDAANKLRDRLRGQGFDGYVDSVGTAKGKLWRVRAGPYASRQVAASTREQIAQKLNIKGNVVAQ